MTDGKIFSLFFVFIVFRLLFVVFFLNYTFICLLYSISICVCKFENNTVVRSVTSTTTITITTVINIIIPVAAAITSAASAATNAVPFHRSLRPRLTSVSPLLCFVLVLVLLLLLLTSPGGW